MKGKHEGINIIPEFFVTIFKKRINFIRTSAANSAFITDKKKCRVWRVDRRWFTRVYTVYA